MLRSPRTHRCAARRVRADHSIFVERSKRAKNVKYAPGSPVSTTQCSAGIIRYELSDTELPTADITGYALSVDNFLGFNREIESLVNPLSQQCTDRFLRGQRFSTDNAF